MSGLATVIIVLVWASQCLAFIRYYWWYVNSLSSLFRNRHKTETEKLTLHRLSIHKAKLRGETFKKFDRWSSDNPDAPFSSHSAYLQPIPAIFGLVGCLLTVFFFSSASWWDREEKATAVVATWIAVCFPIPTLPFLPHLFIPKLQLQPSNAC